MIPEQDASDSRARRILVVTPVGLEGRGGIDRLNLYLVSHLKTMDKPPQLAFLGSRGEWGGPFWVLHFAWALLRFVGVLLFGKFDLVHIHVSTDGSAFRKMIFGAIARLLGKPYVIHFHGDIKQAGDARPPLWVKALGNLARGAACCIVLGESFAVPFRDKLGVQQDRIRIVHNGIPDIGGAAIVPREVRPEVHLLFSGEVGRRKGIDLLLGALAQLGSDAPQWKCTIAGNGDLEPWIRIVAERRLQGRVAFVGWLEISRVHEFMRDADIILLPSRAEALPLALIEGASAGAALIAADVGAVRDVVVEGENGLIVPHDEAAIAAALRSLMNGRKRLAGMQIASRDLFLRQFHIARFAAAILDIHDECIAARLSKKDLRVPAE